MSTRNNALNIKTQTDSKQNDGKTCTNQERSAVATLTSGNVSFRAKYITMD